MGRLTRGHGPGDGGDASPVQGSTVLTRAMGAGPRLPLVGRVRGSAGRPGMANRCLQVISLV